MTHSGRSPAFEKLRRLARPAAPLERCEMCGRTLAREHQHVIRIESRALACACDACAILFTSQSKYKRVPRRVVRLDAFRITDSQWDGLRMPINLAFFFRNSAQGRVIAIYPSPAGATESLLPLETWEEIAGGNASLGAMQADVEALLVNRVVQVRGFTEPDYYLLPIDLCYQLVGLIRSHWQGLSGGADVWREIGEFFAMLRRRSMNGADARLAVPAGAAINAGPHA